MKMFSYTTDQLTGMSNDVIDAYLDQLRSIGAITPEEYDRLVKYRIVVAERNTFGVLWSRLFSKDQKEDHLVYTLVKTFKQKSE